jgi:hypothetical protein
MDATAVELPTMRILSAKLARDLVVLGLLPLVLGIGTK